MDEATMFAAGAYSVASEAGMTDRAARSFASGMLKTSAKRRVRIEDDEDEDEDDGDTWWNRNKHWALPTAIGLGAFLVGSDAGRYGREDRNYFSNAGNRLLERLKNLLGIPNADKWRMMTKAPTTQQPDNATPPAGAPEPKPYKEGIG